MGTYFTDWVEEAQRREKVRMANPEVTSHPGFGTETDEAMEAAWVQFFDYVMFLNDGSPDEPDVERNPGRDDEETEEESEEEHDGDEA